MTKKLDQRRPYYLILDCETATLPYASTLAPEEKKKFALAKPLIYDIGWVICDRRGRIYDKKSFLVAETFSNNSIFETAYYQAKRPLYIEKLKKHGIIIKSWVEIAKILEQDAQKCVAVGAYNAFFDFKKAIPFTQEYIKNFYSNNFLEWENSQKNPQKSKKSKKFDKENFYFLGKKYPLFDIWRIACDTILNTEKFKKFCIKNNAFTSTAKYFSTTAENVFRFLSYDKSFNEEHTALSDAEIETEIFGKIVNRSLKNLKIGINSFPFKSLGTVQEYTEAAALAL